MWQEREKRKEREKEEREIDYKRERIKRGPNFAPSQS
jgi:hypothetical protein